MADAITMEARRVRLSEDLARPGDYVFVPKRDAKVTYERYPALPPEGYWRRLWWSAFGDKHVTRAVTERQWPEQDTVILNCPKCRQPVATTARHEISCVEPLTVATPVTCPYCKTTTFEVKDGKLTTTT